MASGWTNKGKYSVLGWVYRADAEPTNFYMALFTSAVAPTVDINTFSELTQINTGNGYTTGGYQLVAGSTDWDVHTEDDTNDWALVQNKDIVWTAAGGSIPNGGNGASWACLTDDNATEADRLILHWFDLVSPRTVSDTQTLTLQDCEYKIT